MTKRTFLVTGALGCIGSWTIYHLLQQGKQVVSFDISKEGHRLDLLLSHEEQQQITFVQGDLSDFDQVLAAIQTHNITNIIHLAALQVPFCRDNPVRGAQVNVVGTTNIFEAANQAEIKHVAYASSIAVYGPPDQYPPGLIAHDAPFDPRTIYGVYKVTNEGTAKIYWQDHQISSTALRPYTVYGLGRDQGLTSDPTKAILAAAANTPFEVKFSGKMQLQLASDVARQFIQVSLQPLGGAYVFNLGGEIVEIASVLEMIRTVKPGAEITHIETHLPFPDGFDDTELNQHFDTVHQTPLNEGIAQTIQQFEERLMDGRIHAENK